MIPKSIQEQFSNQPQLLKLLTLFYSDDAAYVEQASVLLDTLMDIYPEYGLELLGNLQNPYAVDNPLGRIQHDKEKVIFNIIVKLMRQNNPKINEKLSTIGTIRIGNIEYLTPELAFFKHTNFVWSPHWYTTTHSRRLRWGGTVQYVRKKLTLPGWMSRYDIEGLNVNHLVCRNVSRIYLNEYTLDRMLTVFQPSKLSWKGVTIEKTSGFWTFQAVQNIDSSDWNNINFWVQNLNVFELASVAVENTPYTLNLNKFPWDSISNIQLISWVEVDFGMEHDFEIQLSTDTSLPLRERVIAMRIHTLDSEELLKLPNLERIECVNVDIQIFQSSVVSNVKEIKYIEHDLNIPFPQIQLSTEQSLPLIERVIGLKVFSLNDVHVLKFRNLEQIQCTNVPTRLTSDSWSAFPALKYFEFLEVDIDKPRSHEFKQLNQRKINTWLHVTKNSLPSFGWLSERKWVPFANCFCKEDLLTLFKHAIDNRRRYDRGRRCYNTKVFSNLDPNIIKIDWEIYSIFDKHRIQLNYKDKSINRSYFVMESLHEFISEQKTMELRTYIRNGVRLTFSTSSRDLTVLNGLLAQPELKDDIFSQDLRFPNGEEELLTIFNTLSTVESQIFFMTICPVLYASMLLQLQMKFDSENEFIEKLENIFTAQLVEEQNLIFTTSETDERLLLLIAEHRLLPLGKDLQYHFITLNADEADKSNLLSTLEKHNSEYLRYIVLFLSWDDIKAAPKSIYFPALHELFPFYSYSRSISWSTNHLDVSNTCAAKLLLETQRTEPDKFNKWFNEKLTSRLSDNDISFFSRVIPDILLESLHNGDCHISNIKRIVLTDVLLAFEPNAQQQLLNLALGLIIQFYSREQITLLRKTAHLFAEESSRTISSICGSSFWLSNIDILITLDPTQSWVSKIWHEVKAVIANKSSTRSYGYYSTCRWALGYPDAIKNYKWHGSFLWSLSESQHLQRYLQHVADKPLRLSYSGRLSNDTLIELSTLSENGFIIDLSMRKLSQLAKWTAKHEDGWNLLTHVLQHQETVEINKWPAAAVERAIPLLNPNTKSLKIIRCNLTSLPDLSHLSTLQSLYLYDNRLTELPLSALPKTIKEISISKNRFQTIPQSLEELSMLTKIYCKGIPLCAESPLEEKLVF